MSRQQELNFELREWLESLDYVLERRSPSEVRDLLRQLEEDARFLREAAGPPSMFIFLVGYMRFWGRASWALTMGISCSLWIFCYGLFHHILIIPWPQTVLGNFFPVLRTINWANLF